MFDTIKEDIKVVFERDPAARTAIETLTACPGLHAILFHRLNHWLWKKKLYLLARVSAHVARFLTGIEIHPGATIGQRFFIDHGMGIVIGETAEIGDNCSIYHGVTLGGTTWNKGKRHPTLEDDVVIGAGAKVLGPITIGEGSHIGSNSVVVKNVPAGSTVVGIPGHIVTDKERKTKRDELAENVGFDAYAAADMPDPVSNAIDGVLDHLHNMQKKIDELEKQLKEKK
ncbi:MAG: serine O-acetyltransferase [Gammaproteobacteria bacterium]|jgi:serine O-acetyltransferase